MNTCTQPTPAEPATLDAMWAMQITSSGGVRINSYQSTLAAYNTITSRMNS